MAPGPPQPRTATALAEAILRQINFDIPPGTRLSVIALAATHRAKVAVTRRALRALEQIGIVRAEGEGGGRRWYVASPEPDRPRPNAGEVTASLRQRIRSGALPVGARLMVNELTLEYRVGPWTIRSAIGILAGEGLLMRTGRGKATCWTVVTDQPPGSHGEGNVRRGVTEIGRVAAEIRRVASESEAPLGAADVAAVIHGWIANAQLRPGSPLVVGALANEDVSRTTTRTALEALAREQLVTFEGDGWARRWYVAGGKPRQPTSIGENVADHLRGRIATGQLAAGSPLDIGALAGQYHVSRPTLRTALEALAREPLVTFEGGDRARRWYVAGAKPRQPTGLAKEVADDLRERIATGQIAAGSQLGVAALADEYHVSQPLIRRALEALARERLVTFDGDGWGRRWYVADTQPQPPRTDAAG